MFWSSAPLPAAASAASGEAARRPNYPSSWQMPAPGHHYLCAKCHEQKTLTQPSARRKITNPIATRLSTEPQPGTQTTSGRGLWHHTGAHMRQTGMSCGVLWRSEGQAAGNQAEGMACTARDWNQRRRGWPACSTPARVSAAPSSLSNAPSFPKFCSRSVCSRTVSGASRSEQHMYFQCFLGVYLL